MGKFIIEGGHRLKGEITPQGAKNEALQILCATLLTSEPVTVHNLPRIQDVLKLIRPTPKVMFVDDLNILAQCCEKPQAMTTVSPRTQGLNLVTV